MVLSQREGKEVEIKRRHIGGLTYKIKGERRDKKGVRVVVIFVLSLLTSPVVTFLKQTFDLLA